ncbi:hypothetical protein JCM10207_000809 [Rhodosporidiobolus poonsookiae]
MPAITTDSLVLVTGASGYLGAHVAQQALERGFRVRGTVRSTEKGDFLTKLFKDDPKWSYAIVEDIQQEGAFNEAVKGVDAILHTASPFHFNGKHPDDLIKPAVQGTTGVLKSAIKESTVKRIVITASFASIFNPEPLSHTFTEKDWNTASPAEVERDGAQANPRAAYRASKTLAERAAWKFVEDEKPQFDLAVVNPTLIIGPVIHEVPSADKLNTSVNNFYKFLVGKSSADDAQASFAGYVDVRDVAALHLDALVTPEAGNERFLASYTESSWQPLLDLFFSTAPESLLAAFPNAEKGKPGNPAPEANKIDSSKAKKVLRWKPTDPKDTMLDMAASLAEYQKKW